MPAVFDGDAPAPTDPLAELTKMFEGVSWPGGPRIGPIPGDLPGGQTLEASTFIDGERIGWRSPSTKHFTGLTRRCKIITLLLDWH